MFPIRYRKTVAWLLGVFCALLLVWLALPRLLGLAAERWLAIPGVESLRVDIAEITGGQLKLRELQGSYRSAGGDRLRFALADVTVDYSAARRQIERLDVGRTEFDLFPADKPTPSPWPRIVWPQETPREVRLHDLQLTLHPPQGTPFVAQGRLDWQRTGDQVQTEFHTATGRLQIAAAQGDTLDLRAEWQPNAGPVASVQIRIGSPPGKPPVNFSANLPLPLVAEMAEAAGIKLPLTSPRGTIVLQAVAQLGETSGTLRTLDGEAEFVDAGAQVPGTNGDTQAGKPLALSLAGKVRFGWQAPQASLELQPGLRWQVTADAMRTDASGQLEHPFTITRASDNFVSAGDFPVTLRAAQWGSWDGIVQDIRLVGGPALADWRAANARVRIKGLLPRWQHGAFALHHLRTTGDALLNWSPARGLHSMLALQFTPERLTLSGDSPFSVTRSAWAVKAEASANPAEGFWQSLAIRGEASSPQLTLTQSPPERTISLGPTRLQLSHFKPAQAGGAQADLSISADALRVSPAWPAPDLRARIRLGGGLVRSEGSVLLQGKEAARFAGSHTLARDCGEATLSARHALPALGKLLQPRPPVLAPLDLAAGEADADLTLEWCKAPNAKFDAKGKLHLRDASLGWEKAQARGVQASLQLDGWQPLRGRLQLAAPHGQLATGTELTHLDLDFALTGPTLQLNALHLDLLGGSVHGEPITLPWPPADQTLPLEIRQIDMGRLLDLFKIQGLSGSGRLDGVLPLAYRDGALEVHDGRLNSAGDGTLKYAPSLSLPDNPGLQALRNLHFRKLDMRLNYASGGAYRTESTLEGSNPDFYDGYPIRFSLNINGELPGLFRAALFSGDFNRHILEQLQSGKLQ